MRTYLTLENNGKGSNLTIQTLDGILCHNGEVLLQKYEPVKKSKDDVINQYNNCYKDKKYNNIMPMTLEGCVVRISDIIAYIGRDLEDAINLGLLNRSDIPEDITKVLGSTNREIVNAIVTDIVKNSMNKPYIMLSDEVYNAIEKLKDFNYKNVYYKSLNKEEHELYKEKMNKLYQKYVNDIENENFDSEIFKVFLNSQNSEYNENTKPKRKVLDFIAGMTDDYFLKNTNN
jgi:dGTPase